VKQLSMYFKGRKEGTIVCFYFCYIQFGDQIKKFDSVKWKKEGGVCWILKMKNPW
jgi:hypothetical protein